jgi:hypothetical protein
MKKIGLLCLALVLALGTLGVGYAMWSDQITIEGTVNTGSVEISINATSETYVYKNLTDRKIVMSPEPLNDPELMLVASATTQDVSTAAEKKVRMTFTNIFPTATPIVADVLLHYTGSVPAHVVVLEDEGDVDPAIAPYLIQTWLMQDEAGRWVETPMENVQLHYCNLVWLQVYLNATKLQLDGRDAQNLTGNFTKTIVVHQWNEDWPDNGK